MKVFVLKFLVLFSLIIGYFTWYRIAVYPNICGELDVLGQIPFGPEYKERLDSIYPHGEKLVVDETSFSSSYRITTIGDSFSGQGILGYQQFLGEIEGDTIQNIKGEGTPEQTFITLLNSDAIPKGTCVIVESVERSMIKRLCNLDFTAKFDGITNRPSSVDNDKMTPLEGAMSKLRIVLGYKNPIRRYNTTEDLFTHKKRHNQLYLFDSPWESYKFGIDGDFVFRYLSEKDFEDAYVNLMKIKQKADEKDVNLIYLIAADKYEVYEPFVMEKHPHNPTLDKCPKEFWLINTKPLLQELALDGVKDVYRIDDTHWSPIGAKIVAEEIARRLTFENEY